MGGQWEGKSVGFEAQRLESIKQPVSLLGCLPSCVSEFSHM